MVPSVTVASYETSPVAHLARERLEAEGIEADVEDEHLADWHYFYSRAAGGVRVRVDGADLLRARDVLQSGREASPPPGECCPDCGAHAVTRNRRITRWFTLLYLFPLSVLLVFPFGLLRTRWTLHLPRLWRRWACDDCGRSWRNHPAASDADTMAPPPTVRRP